MADPVASRPPRAGGTEAEAPTRRAALALGLGAGLAACALPSGDSGPPPAALLPLRTDQGGRLTVEVDTPPHGRHRFLIDTGAGVSALFEGGALAAAARGEPDSARVWGLGGTAVVPTLIVPPQSLGGLRLPARRVVLLPRTRGSTGLEGIIGMDVLSGRMLSVDRAAGTLSVGLLGHSFRPARGWDRVPLAPLSRLPGAASLLFGRMDLGDRRFPALIDLGSDATYCSWAAASASPGLRRLRRDLYRTSQVEGAVARFRPELIVEVEGLVMGRHRWGPTEITILELESAELMGEGGEPVVIAGINLLAGRDFVFDAAGRVLALRRADGARGPRAAWGDAVLR